MTAGRTFDHMLQLFRHNIMADGERHNAHINNVR